MLILSFFFKIEKKKNLIMQKLFSFATKPRTKNMKNLLLGLFLVSNSMISLALIYMLFKDSKIVKFSMLLYIVFGSVLMISFFFVLKFFGPETKMVLFYIRRFIIQPIFVMLFIPAFYYQKRMK